MSATKRMWAFGDFPRWEPPRPCVSNITPKGSNWRRSSGLPDPSGASSRSISRDLRGGVA